MISLLGLLVHQARSEILTPPYFNLAEGKEIIASATCGVDTPGAELYCKLVGANADQHEDINLIQGQVGIALWRKENDFGLSVVCYVMHAFHTVSFASGKQVKSLEQLLRTEDCNG